MDILLVRLVLIVGFVAYMAAIYLILHMIFARVVHAPNSRVMWFFSVVTRPITGPVRALLPPGTSEPRVRWVALGVYALLWLLTKILLARLGVVSPT